MDPRTNTPSQGERSFAPDGNGSINYLAQDYARWNRLLDVQPPMIRRYLEAEAAGLAQSLAQLASQTRFSLPERVVVNVGDNQESSVPADQREQLVGGLLMNRLAHSGLNAAARHSLDELEASTDPAVAASAGLLRYVTAIALVHDLLPDGRAVRYLAADGDEIPNIPEIDEAVADSAITAQTDAIVEEKDENGEEGRGELIVPYVPAARFFFLPQWVAFDFDDQLLVHSTAEAEAYLSSMQRFVRILHSAVALAPYMVADKAYQRKRYGMLGQLVNQGRALTRYLTREIIATIQRRAAASDLNRGLSLSLPYFDDQLLEMKTHDFDVIPAARIMFVPAFVVLAARKEQVKVEQDTRLNRSTRKHLLAELKMLEVAF
jgi:hypothetical protein